MVYLPFSDTAEKKASRKRYVEGYVKRYIKHYVKRYVNQVLLYEALCEALLIPNLRNCFGRESIISIRGIEPDWLQAQVSRKATKQNLSLKFSSLRFSEHFY